MSAISNEQIEKYFELIDEKLNAINKQAEILVITAEVWQAISEEQYDSYNLFDKFQNSTALKAIIYEVSSDNDLSNNWLTFEAEPYFKENLKPGFTQEYRNLLIRVIHQTEDMLSLYESINNGSLKKMLYFIGQNPNGYLYTGIEKLACKSRKETGAEDTTPSKAEEAVAKVFDVIADVGSGRIDSPVAGYAPSVKKIVFGIVILIIGIFMLWLTYFAFSTNTMMFAMLAAVFTIVHFVTGISKLRNGIREYKEAKAQNDENEYM